MLEFYEARAETMGDREFTQALDMIKDHWRWGEWCMPGRLTHAEKLEIWSKSNDEHTDKKAPN